MQEPLGAAPDAASDPDGGADGERCVLSHRLFRALGEPLFRRAESDGEPAMVVRLGERDAAIPLRALLREFGIDAESGDARMVGLIVESLDFVSGLRLGDALPPEVLTGEASWEPGPEHLAAASVRARGLSGASELVGRTEELAAEFAYIEALRERLLRRIQAMMVRIRPLGRGWRGDLSRLETLAQVQRLTALALNQIGGRFAELDARTDELLAALGNAQDQRAFIRANRDWLYRTLRAWDPILASWDVAEPAMTDPTWALLGRTYRFLAPRFMPITEWTLVLRPGRPRSKRLEGMVW